MSKGAFTASAEAGGTQRAELSRALGIDNPVIINESKEEGNGPQQPGPAPEPITPEPAVVTG